MHLEYWPDDLPRLSQEERREWDLILELRDTVLKALESAREKDLIGSSLEASIV